MQYSARPRRFRKIAAANVAANANMITAGQVLTGAGFNQAQAERYAAQITRTAQKIGAAVAATTYAKHGGRARPVAAYDLSRDAVNLVVALGTYRPSLSATVTAKGQPSKSKAAEKQRAAHAAYVRTFTGRDVVAPARVSVAA